MPSSLTLPPIDGETPTVVHLSAEYYPYARTGGLAEASWGLQRDQQRKGLNTAAVMPMYQRVWQHLKDPVEVGEPWSLRFGNRRETFKLWRDRSPSSETPIFFIQHEGYFDRPGIYGTADGDYADNPERYSSFAAAAVSALPRITPGPVLLHIHDWHCAPAAVYLRNWWQREPWFSRIPVVMSIHNGGYQGHFPSDTIETMGLPWSAYNTEGLEWHNQVNFLKGGLKHCDAATTVSPTHSKELRTVAGGFGLHGTFRALGDRFTGILNGIDPVVWDPAADTQIAEQYSSSDLSGKAACKADLQRRYGLPVNPDIPLVALAGRMVTQKGIQLVVHNHGLFNSNAQFVFLGSGEKQFEDSIRGLQSALPDRVSIKTMFSDELEHLLMAGADIFLMPSQYEPCGLTQMRAQRYGTVPVARRVGGLADTIEDGVGGFLFNAFDERALAGGMWRALTEYRSRDSWLEMQQAGMAREFGWDRVAERYTELYARAIQHRHEVTG